MIYNFSINPVDFANSAHLFYYFGILAVAVIMLFDGYKRKYPMQLWLPVVVSGVLGAVIGGKLFGLTYADWQQFFTSYRFPVSENKSALGYILFGFLAGFSAKKYLGFKQPIAGSLIYAWPVGLIIARFGCLFSGCCHGTVCNSGLGIVYGADSLAHSVHLHEGWIAQNSLFALPVHATQIYEIIFMVLLLALTGFVQYKKVFQSERSLLFFSFGVYAVFRFFEEFIRDGGHEAFGLKTVQWILLVFVLLASVVIFNIEKKPKQLLIAIPEVNTRKSFKIILLNVILIVFGLNYYSPLELVLLKTLLFFIIVGFVVELIRESYVNKLVRMPVLMLVSAVLFMGQTTTEQTNPVDSLKSFFTISGGASQGTYTEICGSTHHYNGTGLGLRYTGYLHKDATMYGGIDYYYLQQRFPGRTINNFYENNVFRPYFGLSSKYLELSAGYNLSFAGANSNETNFLDEGMISLYSRLGSQRSFFVDAGLFNSFPTHIPVFSAGFGVGSKKYGTIARFGLSESGFYLNPFIRLNKNVVIEPIVYYGDQNLQQFTLRTHINLFLPPKPLQK